MALERTLCPTQIREVFMPKSTTPSRKKTTTARSQVSNPSSPLLPQTQTDKTEEYIQQVLSYLPQKKTLHQFANLFLHSMSMRALQTYSHPDLAEFLQARFDFFKKAALLQGDFRIVHRKLGNSTTFELVFPDAPDLLITLESLFRNFDLRIVFKVHPLLGSKLDKKRNLAEITAPSPKIQRMCHMYVEFEDPHNPETLQRLKPRIKSHLAALKESSQHRDAIFKKLETLQKMIPNLVISQPEPQQEWCDLLEWLKSHFSFYGYATFSGFAQEQQIHLLADSGLGLFSSAYLEQAPSSFLDTLLAHIWERRNDARAFVMDTIKVKSPIKRFENLMCLSLKIPNTQGVLEEHIFLGSITQSSLQTRSLEVPVIRFKLHHIFAIKKMLEHSYEYNEVIRIFIDIPLFELFRTPAPTLLGMVEDLFSINDPNRIYCFVQRGSSAKLLRLLVAIPTTLFSRENLKIIVDYLKTQIPHTDCEGIEVRGINICRLHLSFDLSGNATWSLDLPHLEAEIGELIKSWEERVRQALYEQYPSSLSEQLCHRYLPVMPQHYQVRSAPKDTVRDIMFLEQLLHEEGVQFELTPFQSPSPIMGKVSLLYIYSRTQNDLFLVMPILQNMGFYVVDQLNARIGSSEETYGYIQSFRVQDSHRQPIDIARHKTLIVDMLKAIFEERTENDPLNALCILADLDWRAINVLALYRNLYLQISGNYTRSKVNATLCAYPQHTRQLFEYFEAKFSLASQFGDLEYRKKVLLPEKQKTFMESLRSVDEVADDVILRRLFNLLETTLRTNFYIPKAANETFISIKLDSKKVHEIPVPAPYREIYVHDVGMEGTHLRFGSVARGGLRWSDRLDDFRTEILGLVKTQQTKNVVIVPVGSKGGFVVKNQFTSREEIALESQKQYQKFISALLDITDNRDTNREAKHPSHLIPYDDLDPYLVVAADKGTATFSDLANSVSTQYKFWLDDAFASGGSVGYDHKKEGITARGAWECVKLHFKEKGKDIQTSPTTVVGIGDMSGDVFGNGMLLSKALKLRAAFNHLHIFLDPDPDPERSWQERQRLFNLPRSTWQDYDAKLISPGGGIFERKAKEILLSPQIQQMLGVEKDMLNGEELIQAILRMKAELLWFGGIGTYIKSDQETHFQVGDQANDAIRISVSECQIEVIGEGANLGLTQPGRIEFSKKGVLNTDAIDNSAGVNMSDYEVNIKILLQQMLQQKHLQSTKERNALLAEATDEVSELVLANNRGQHRLISMDMIRSEEQFRIFKYLIRYLITEKGLDDRSEHIPTRGMLEQMDEAQETMPRPILAVLQAYLKMWIYNSLLESEILNDPYLESIYGEYFPLTIRKRFGKKMTNHPLKREITGTLLTNRIVNQAGITFFFRLEQLTGKSIAEIATTYLIFDESLAGALYRESVLAAEQMRERDKYRALILLEDILRMLVQSYLKISNQSPSFKLIAQYKTLLKTLKSSIATTKSPTVKTHWQEIGFSEQLAEEISVVEELQIAPDIIYLHEQEQVGVAAALQLTLQVNNTFKFQWLKEKLQSLDLETDWDQSHQDILLQTIELHKLNVIRLLLQHHDEKALVSINAEDLLTPVSQQFTVPLATYFQTLNQLQTGSPINLTTLSVCINRLNFLEVMQE